LTLAGKFLFAGSLSSGLLGSSDLLSLDAGALGLQRLTLSLVQLASTGAGVLDDTSRLTATVAQVVELGAADLTAADDFDALDQRRVDREHALDAFAVRDLADGEVLLEARTRARDADAVVG